MSQHRTWLRALRESRGFSQEDLAERVGVDVGTYGRWERGAVASIRTRNLAALADALGLSLRQIREAAGHDAAKPVDLERPGTGRANAALDPIGSLRSIVDGYRGLDHSMGPDGMLDVVQSKLVVARRLEGLTQGVSDRRRLLGLVAEVHQLVGWMQFDMLELDAARRSFDAARTVAAEADSPELLAYVLGPSAAFAEADLGRPVDGLDLAYAAIGHAHRTGNQRLIAFVHAIAARVHAKLGDERLALESIEKSAQAMVLHDGWEADPVWLHVFDETALAGHSGSVELDLGRAEPAVALLGRQEDTSKDVFVRNRAIWSLDRARAYRDLGELEQAGIEVMRALDLVTSTTSRRTESKLIRLATSISDGRGGSVANDLREVLADRSDPASKR